MGGVSDDMHDVTWRYDRAGRYWLGAVSVNGRTHATGTMLTPGLPEGDAKAQILDVLRGMASRVDEGNSAA